METVYDDVVTEVKEYKLPDQVQRWVMQPIVKQYYVDEYHYVHKKQDVVHPKTVVNNHRQNIVNEYYQPVIKRLHTRKIEQDVVHQTHLNPVTELNNTIFTESHEDINPNMEAKGDSEEKNTVPASI